MTPILTFSLASGCPGCQGASFLQADAGTQAKPER
jgi:hypothetical protein